MERPEAKPPFWEASKAEPSGSQQSGAESCEIQTLLKLDIEAWTEFQRLLDAPPRELPALKNLLQSKPVWEA